MSFITLSKEVVKDRCLKNNPQTLYFNFVDYFQNILRGQTPYTPAINTINQLYDRLKRIDRRGAASYIAYCSDLAKHFRDQLKKNTMFTIPDYSLSNCLTPVFCPKNNAKFIFNHLKNNYDIYVTPCAGEISSFLLRVVHMSQELTKHDLDELVTLLMDLPEEL
jgi:aspartate aminotransferase-like enzyme